MAIELNQQTNNLVINGYLKDKNLKHNNFGNGDVIMGTVDVAFKDGDKHNVQRINVFASQYTKAGKENPSYKSIAKVESDYHAGKENPDRVHVTGRLDYNIFKTRNGDIVKTLRKNGAFFRRISSDNDKLKNEARAHVVLTVTGYEDQVKNGEPTGNKIIHNVNVGYGNRVNRIPNLIFNMKSLGNDIDAVVDTFPSGSTIDAQIIFDDYAIVKQSTKEFHGFGHKENMGVATKFVHEAKIDGIEAEAVQGKQSLDTGQVKHAKELLDQRVSQANGQNKKPTTGTNPYANNGSSRPIADDDVPF